MRDPAWSRYGAWVVCPLLGAGLLLLLNFLSGRLASTSWMPWQPAFELASSVPEPWAVPDTPALDSGANAVFADRRRALDEDRSGDAAALRTELGNMGVVVRDGKKRQYWRRTSDSSG
ncbi:CysS/YqeB C-terminal domain-containing protein [Haloactinomyces albus]|uniref:Cysteinyl-tRNA ligase anticodon binding domain-containing protein n=1 Tax=Haloactinomyces albus TaxID=1352928 RepID=A0AAE3ZEG2_9ACTN|nr:hypothetical protein [Haloactinomyces albus]MDR7302059.1 hypothetical protein [Haloactinomyces albus]